MANTRVIYISEITAGSKFRTVANNTAKAKAKKFNGTHWASCKVTDNGGNFQLPSFTDPGDKSLRGHQILNATFGWITLFPAKFNIFNKPCPWAIGHSFIQGSR